MNLFRLGRVSLVLLACCLASCSPDASVNGQEENAGQNPRRQECPPDVICTEMFATVAATPKYPDNQPVILDSYRVIETATGADKTPDMDAAERTMYQKMGVYPITTDKHQKELANQKREVAFIGTKDGKEIIRRTFTIGADCCHVKLIAGDLEIRVEK